MSFNNQDFTEHTRHIGKFHDGCTYCEEAKGVGVWQSGEFITFAELQEMEKNELGNTEGVA